jgi:hypothetical protein
MGAGPSPSIRRDGQPAATLRAAIAVLSLYAFLLQAFLGGLMPMPSVAQGLCLQHAAADTAPGKAVPDGHGDCCTAALAAGTALPPRATPAPVIWNAGPALRPAWTMTAAVGARGPPGSIASPRGPPAT